MSVLKGMTVRHEGRELNRYVYFGSQSACVQIGKKGHEVRKVGPGVYETVRLLPDIEWNIIMEQAEETVNA